MSALITETEIPDCPRCYGIGFMYDGDDSIPCDHPQCTYWAEIDGDPSPVDFYEAANARNELAYRESLTPA